MRKSILFLCLVAMVFMVALIWFKPNTIVVATEAPAQTETISAAPTSDTSPPQVVEVAKTGNYRLIVGANPSLGKAPVFSPPTNSVEITNELQLRLLIEQTRPKQTNQQQ